MNEITIGAVVFSTDPVLASLAKALDASGVDVSDYKDILAEANSWQARASAAARDGDMKTAVTCVNKAAQIRALAFAVAKANQTALKTTATVPLQKVTIDPVPGVVLPPSANNNILIPGAGPAPAAAPAGEGEDKPGSGKTLMLLAVLGIGAWWFMRKKG